MATTKSGMVKINGKEFAVADLSKTARDQLMNLRACDAEIARLKVQLAIAETARNAYARVLDGQLPANQ